MCTFGVLYIVLIATGNNIYPMAMADADAPVEDAPISVFSSSDTYEESIIHRDAAASPETIVPAAESIGEEKAKEIALAHAGIKAADAQILRVRIDREDGRTVYEVDFIAGGAKYEYDIDVQTGEILKSEREQFATGSSSTGESIGEEKAKEIALAHAGIKAADAQILRVRIDREDGRTVYEVDFIAGGAKYEYDIDVQTGEILKSEREQFAANSSSTEGSIGEEKAKEIAFAHAGIKSTDAMNLRVEIDRENGRLVYDVQFVAGGMKYEYEIDIQTGEIVKSEKEKTKTAKTPAPTNNGGTSGQSGETIGTSKAKSIAFKHAGVSASNAKRVHVELERENGRLIYEVDFTAGGIEYEYDIDAKTGKILKHEAERDD